MWPRRLTPTASPGDGGQQRVRRVGAAQGDRQHDVRHRLRQHRGLRSAITYIDGDAGILRYRGYPIEELAEKSSFLETCYLVLYGELPTKEQFDTFENTVRRHTLVDERLREFFRSFPRRSHPMPVLSAGVTALSTFSTDTVSISDWKAIDMATFRLLAKLPTLAAMGYKNSMGHPFMYPDNSLGYVENFLRMSFGYPTEPYEIDPMYVRALDVLLILHADHEQNCSTSTVRLVGSAQANIYVSVVSGINALSGPLHGGANQAGRRDAREDPRRPAATWASSSRTSRTRRTAQADGLRAPGLQELRPARRDHQEARRRDPEARQDPGRTARHRAAARRGRRPTTTSWSASSTPTWTSTRASSTRRWASRSTCSPCCSPSAGCPAGSPSGAR
jgi:hypothetical protein